MEIRGGSKERKEAQQSGLGKVWKDLGDMGGKWWSWDEGEEF